MKVIKEAEERWVQKPPFKDFGDQQFPQLRPTVHVTRNTGHHGSDIEHPGKTQMVTGNERSFGHLYIIPEQGYDDQWNMRYAKRYLRKFGVDKNLSGAIYCDGDIGLVMMKPNGRPLNGTDSVIRYIRVPGRGNFVITEKAIKLIRGKFYINKKYSDEFVDRSELKGLFESVMNEARPDIYINDQEQTVNYSDDKGYASATKYTSGWEQQRDETADIMLKPVKDANGKYKGITYYQLFIGMYSGLPVKDLLGCDEKSEVFADSCAVIYKYMKNNSRLKGYVGAASRDLDFDIGDSIEDSDVPQDATPQQDPPKEECVRMTLSAMRNMRRAQMTKRMGNVMR